MSKRLRCYFLIPAVLILSSCACGAPPIAEPVLLPPAWLVVPPAAELPQPPENPTLEDLVENHIETAGLYHAMRVRFMGLVRWLEAVGKK